MRAFVLVLAALTGCAPGDPLPPVALSSDIQTRAEDAIRATLKDPQSAQFERMRAGSAADGATLVCGFVNAKNGFGGYTGRKLFAVRVSGSSATVEAFAVEGHALGVCHRHNLIPA